MIENLMPFEGMEITINTTEDCNLRCKYCFEINKKPRSIELDTCKKFIDLIVGTEDPLEINGTKMEYLYDGLIVDFIGGDSLIDPKLLDEILKYFQYKLVVTNHKAKNNWRCAISTNGTLFGRKDVRDFCEKWSKNLSIGVSIDGCPEIHDMNRIFSNGEGSMKAILKNWDWYKKVFPVEAQSTKATCSRNSIPYLFKSLKYMYEVMGIKYINQNFIMEDTGATEEDYVLFDEQMGLCKDYVLEHSDDLYWGMLSKNFSTEGPLFENSKEDYCTSGRCGSGYMPTLSINGDIYPCFRWLPHTQNEEVMKVGDVWNGFNKKENFVAVQEGSIRSNCTTEEKCKTCELEPMCPYCIAGGYQEFESFTRQTHICRYTQIQNKWAEIYWKEYNEKKSK